MLLLLPLALFGVNTYLSTLSTLTAPTSKKAAEKAVLGHMGRGYYASPQIYIVGGEDSVSSGGVISIASTDESAVYISGYNISGNSNVAVYRADEESLLNYLTHDKDGKQTKNKPDVSKFQFVANVKHGIDTKDYQGTKVTLPLADKGIWYLRVTADKTEADAFVVRSNIGVIVKEGDNEFIFWGQNYRTKRSINTGEVSLYNMQEPYRELQKVLVDDKGVATAPLFPDVDVALIRQDGELALIPVNLKYLNMSSGYNQFKPKTKRTRYFIFTDRPLYRPGDKVYFKTVLRDDDDARYTVPTGEANVKVYFGYSENENIVYQANLPISSDGTINGEFTLNADAKVGYYTASVSIPNQTLPEDYWWDSEYTTNSVYFDVQYYRKPEYTIDIIDTQSELLTGDDSSFTITGQYFSGQPLVGQKIRYSVNAAEYYEYDYLSDYQSYNSFLSDDYRYGNWYGSEEVTSGIATLNEKGEAKIDLSTELKNITGKNHIFTISATIEDGSMEPAYSRRNLLVYAGEFSIFRKNYDYSSQLNKEYSLPITLVSHRDTGNIDNIKLTTKIHRQNWIAYQEKDKKYESYRLEEEDLPAISEKTDNKGNATFTFTPKKVGSYTLTVEGEDSRGNKIAKVFYVWVSTQDEPVYTETENQLVITPDKQKYKPSETVELTIFSTIPDRDVFLSLERGRVNRFQIVNMKGKSTTVKVPLTQTDMPNIYADVSSFSQSALNRTQENIIVSTESKRVNVQVTPESRTYGPGETVNVNILTTDIAGNPLSSELALWAVDKAIFELSDTKLGDIFTTFWNERYNSTETAHSLEGIVVLQAEGGGCFAAGTKVLMADRSEKNIEDIKAGEYILTRSKDGKTLVKAKVAGTHSSKADGYIILNSHLKLTANHIIKVNGEWKEAGSVQRGDTLIDSKGNKVQVDSVEWQRGNFTVYNLEIETYHTYIANNMWVHNDKGIERKAFEDTAYWNPSIKTDANGRAKVSFKLPDNLTTWTIAAVAATADTKVGQTTEEITVTKDVIVRPILPNILRQGDEAYVSALVQNFTDKEDTFAIDLKFDAGEVEDAVRKSVKIDSKETIQLYWKVKAKTEKDKAKLIFGARSDTNKNAADVVTQEIPVRAFSFVETRAEVGEGNKTYIPRLADDASKEKSSVKLALSSSIVGTLPTAMNYLVGYPYGCVEQTTSRFVPSVIARANPDVLGAAYEDKDINKILEKGIERLKALQKSDGGWTWWYEGKSDIYITAYVMEYLVLAKQLGIPVDDTLYSEGVRFIQNFQVTTLEERVLRTYALSFINPTDKQAIITDTAKLTPDYLSMAVIANYRNGDTNQKTNGLERLQSIAKKQGDGLFWDGGNKSNFGSREASTAFAIRAIVFAKGDTTVATKGVRYLTRARTTSYWSNTYATAQVIRALVDYSRVANELQPNYTYTVTFDGKTVANGTIKDAKQVIKDIVIPVKDLKNAGSKIVINKSGSGQIYSTLLITDYHTDRNAKAVSNGLSVKREYINQKGPEYSLGVGDTVDVTITVSGLQADEYYGVVHDELPAGMVPVNTAFKNQQGYGQNYYDYYYYSYDVTDKEITENGMILSLYRMGAGSRVYTYQARIVSQGTFIAPPATAALMYAPEINGRSEAQTITIDKEANIVPGKAIKYGKLPTVVTKNKKVTGVFTMLLVLGIVVIILWRRGIRMIHVKQAWNKRVNSKAKRVDEPQDLPPIDPEA